jgi:hypothetical protein
MQGADTGRGAFANLSATATEQPLGRVVDQFGLPVVEMLEPDIFGN